MVTATNADDGDEGGIGDEEVFDEEEKDELRRFVKGLSADDVKSGGWFVKLLAHALSTYTRKATYDYFQTKYAGVPADAIIDQRIKMAARYAAVEGGLSAAAYTAAVSTTMGTGGAAVAVAGPAAAGSVFFDLAFTTQLQIRLAYDIAVLYRVPLDTEDPDDLWTLIRVALTIKGGELLGEGFLKSSPLFVRHLLKRFYRKGVLEAARALPVFGQYLLQRNVIKMGIPMVGIPLAVVINRHTTLIAGRHARAVFRNKARVIEIAESLSGKTKHPQLLLWVAWVVINADGKISDDEALLFRHLVQVVRDQHQIVDEQLAHVVDIDHEEFWRRVEAEPGDLSDLAAAATRVAAVDGPVNEEEGELISLLKDRCRRG